MKTNLTNSADHPPLDIQYGPPTYHDRIKAFLIVAVFLAIFLLSAALALGALYALWTLGKALLLLLSGGAIR